MKKILVISDSFKGTLSSQEIADIAKGFRNDEFQIDGIEIADGGEGTIDAFAKILPGEKKEVPVINGDGEKTTSYVYVSGDTAIIEVATVIGLPDSKIKDPSKTTTYGVGQLIKAAVNDGAKKIIIGLGGSSTNDGGVAMAAALGVHFFDKEGKEFTPMCGEDLSLIGRINNKDALAFLNGVKVIGMCDVSNPLYGRKGASYVYAPQKGANAKLVLLLDKKLRHLASVTSKSLGCDKAKEAGAGAAGGLGFGILSFLKGELVPGVKVLLDLLDFSTRSKDYDYVVTGEGKFDRQSLYGKVIGPIAKETKSKIVLIVGRNEVPSRCISSLPIEAIYTTGDKREDFEDIKAHAKEDYADAFRLFLASIRQ